MVSFLSPLSYSLLLLCIFLLTVSSDGTAHHMLEHHPHAGVSTVGGVDGSIGPTLLLLLLLLGHFLSIQ